MKRNKIIQSNNQGKQIEHKRRIAFHEAGHATAIHLNNKARNLPPIFFQIMFKDLNCESEKELWDYQTTLDDHIARVDGGRLILKKSVELNPTENIQHKLDRQMRIMWCV